MKIRLVLFTACVLTAGLAFAQTPPRPASPAAPAAPAPPATPAAPATPAVPAPPQPPNTPRQPINVKIEVTISEDGGTVASIKKVVSTVAGDGFSGSVREVASTSPGTGPVALNVDASPSILPNGKVRVGITLQYSAGQNASTNELRVRTDVRQNVVLILESGKPVVVSEASDPISDRRVTIEVKATILK